MIGVMLTTKSGEYLNFTEKDDTQLVEVMRAPVREVRSTEEARFHAMRRETLIHTNEYDRRYLVLVAYERLFDGDHFCGMSFSYPLWNGRTAMFMKASLLTEFWYPLKYIPTKHHEKQYIMTKQQVQMLLEIGKRARLDELGLADQPMFKDCAVPLSVLDIMVGLVPA